MRRAKRIQRAVLIKSDFKEYLLEAGGMRILDMEGCDEVAVVVVVVVLLLLLLAVVAVRIALLCGRGRSDGMLGDSVSRCCF